MGGTIGLVVNPVAGIGGPTGLKGSDGAETQASAWQRGASAHAVDRALAALAVFAASAPGATVITAAGTMGEDAVRAAGLSASVVYTPTRSTVAVKSPAPPGWVATAGSDTTAAVAAIADAGATLILFAGGDGTARDVSASLPAGTAALGIPAGVKMYSACFAVSPAAAAMLAVDWFNGEKVAVVAQDVLDIDEAQVRSGRVDPRLYGTMLVPFGQGRTQARKAATLASDGEAAHVAAAGVVSRFQPDVSYLLGPGSTMAEVARAMGVPFTPLGVDVIRDGRLVLTDATEAELLNEIRGRQAKAVITVIGGQGFLLGRGNQQLSATVIRALGEDPLLVVATDAKLLALGGQPLLVDTGDGELDAELSGYTRIITGRDSVSVYPVGAPETTAKTQGAGKCS
jgi:predicted polyphosphate/ATP-dependent NAD kinase